MKKHYSVGMGIVLASLLFAESSIGLAAGPNKKIGRVYFKMVCTVCHMQTLQRAIPPATKTMAEWQAYMNANKHDGSGKSKPEVSYYLSQEYRKSIKDKNKAAKKFLKFSNEKLTADVSAFLVSGAKDSDTPASCD